MLWLLSEISSKDAVAEQQQLRTRKSFLNQKMVESTGIYWFDQPRSGLDALTIAAQILEWTEYKSRWNYLRNKKIDKTNSFQKQSVKIVVSTNKQMQMRLQNTTRKCYNRQ